LPSHPDHYHIDLKPEVRLEVRRRDDDGDIDLRLARRSPAADPHRPESWRLTQAGFRLTSEEVIELRAILRLLVTP
jgi:hypothetical protein